MKLILIFIVVVSSLCACTRPAEVNKTTHKSYFDLKGYFEREADRLNKLNRTINKSVAINDIIESKTLKIKDFKTELSSFIASDINKASWAGEFKVDTTSAQTTYQTKFEKIPVKKVEIMHVKEKIKSVLIIIENDNLLYHSVDTLTYFPDSLYQINKMQKIKLLKKKTYKITGRF